MIKYFKLVSFCLLFWILSSVAALGQGRVVGSAVTAVQAFGLSTGSQEATVLTLASEFRSFYPEEVGRLNVDIQSPEQFFGAKIGGMHLSYELVSSYMRYLASVSNRVHLRLDGATYEGRPFISLLISASSNFKNVQPQGVLSSQISKDLLVNWLGYSVHGNEASGVNASVVMAYLLAAGEGSYITDILEKSVVVMVPALNPDGVSGYANWANSNISFAVNTDEHNREFKQQAPTSRSNHYWFDLNRDWLFAQHPEIRSVLRLFHEWNPHIVNDFHEHGNVSGTYFSPGIKSSTNPLIDSQNWDLTDKIARYHASYMDRIGTIYFSREGYDSFYTGKGAAYPSLAGSIGILFEQPNPKGLNNFRQGVELNLSDMIRNQVFCSFSSLVAGAELKKEIFSYSERVKKESKINVAKNPNEAYVFSAGNDISLRNEFFNILDAHNINYYKLKENLSGSSSLGGTFVVPLDQEYPAIIKTIFETQLDFVDSSFYDLSTWTIPMAFNLEYSKMNVPRNKMEESTFNANLSTAQIVSLPEKSEYAYLFSMEDYYSYNFLYYLLGNGVFVKASDRPFSYAVSGQNIDFGTGSIMIPVMSQPFGSDRLYEIICNYFQKHSALDNSFSEIDERGFVAKGVVKVHALTAGRGVDFDLGSRKFVRVTLPSIAIITGKGTTYSSAGELWHLLDQRFRIPVTLLDHSLISAASLSNYNVIVCTNDFGMDKGAQQELAKWAGASGNLFIAINAGARFATKSGIAKIDFKSLSSGSGVSEDDGNTGDELAVGSYISKKNAGRTTFFNGVILRSVIDESHPLSIGVGSGNSYSSSSNASLVSGSNASLVVMPVFKRSNLVANNLSSSFSTYSVIAPDPLLSGYLSNSTTTAIANTPYIIAKKGFVFFPDNPYFRAYWLGTSRTFMNALFFRELF